MAEPEKAPQQQQPKPETAKQVIAEKVSGTVKWFNVKSGYGFINRNDTKEDVFVHQTAIAKNNPRKAVRSVGDGEAVEFAVVAGDKGYEAAEVTGPGGEPVKGSPYAADKRRGYRQFYPRSGGGRGGEGAPRRGGGGGIGGSRRGPPQLQQGGQQEGGPEGAAPQRRWIRRNFRGGRRGGPQGTGPVNQEGRGGYRRPRQQRNANGQATPNNKQSQNNGSATPQQNASAPTKNDQQSSPAEKVDQQATSNNTSKVVIQATNADFNTAESQA